MRCIDCLKSSTVFLSLQKADFCLVKKCEGNREVCAVNFIFRTLKKPRIMNLGPKSDNGEKVCKTLCHLLMSYFRLGLNVSPFIAITF